MSQLTSNVEYLSKEIGPRPAGTEEEQQAALYITEQFQKETGFATAIEDFASSSNVQAALAVLAGVTVVATILAIIFPALAIPAFILATAAAAVYSLEYLDRPIVSRVLSRGASQNVVAKYQPGSDMPEQQTSRRAVRSRKIVLVAHYDTGRVIPPLVERVETSGIPVALVCVIAMVAAAFLLLLRIFVAPGGGMGLLVLNVLAILAAIVCLAPIVKALLVRSAPYNEGATNNASGTAALIEVARRIARGSVSEADLADMADDDVSIHGEAAAREAGLVPEGVQLQYEAEQLTPPSEIGDYNEEERLLSAKAAIAALTGQPIERRVFSSVAENLVNSRAGEMGVDAESLGLEDGFAAQFAVEDVGAAGVAVPGAQAAVQLSTQPQPQPAAAGVDVDGFQNAPSWFVVAQQNAKRSERFNADEAPQVKRSRYTEAIEHAEHERSVLEEELRAAAEAERQAALRIREEEARAALAASAPAPVPEPAEQPAPASAAELAPEPEPAQAIAAAAQVAEPLPESTGAYQPYAVETPEQAPLPQGPDGTTAMPAYVPAAEILAEVGLPDMAPSDSAPEPAPAAQERIAALPSIDPAASPSPEPVKSPSRSGILRNLRANIPSLSGIISPVKDDKSRANASRPSVNPDRVATRRTIESVPPVNSTATQPQQQSQAQLQPLPEVQPQPQAQPQPDLVSVAGPAPEIAVSAAQEPEEQAASVAHTARETVAVPRSRSGNLLSRLKRHTEEDLADTPQQWLDVDDDFEARSVGRARGSWESFRDDQYFDDDEGFGEFAAGDEEPRPRRRWQGGAFSSRLQMGYANTRSGEAEQEVEQPSAELALVDEEDQVISEEIEQIYHFRNPLFNTEIWFVAMGADGESHDGARAFLEEHRDELRGSMIVEIESLGAGTLSVASEEGRVRKVQASSRVKRYTRGATAATGIAPDSVSLAGTDSISSTAQKAGFQTMHLFGAEDGRPALKGSADDVLENVDEMLLDEHVNFVFELLKH